MKRFYLFALAAFSIFLIGCGGGSSSTTTSGSGSNGALSSSLPDFDLEVNFANNATPTFDANGNFQFNLNVRGNNQVTAPIALSLSNPPMGVTATFSPASVTASAAGVPVKATIHSNDPTINTEITLSGKSGTLERFATIRPNPYVAPSGFSIVIKHVSSDDGALIRTFDVVLSQTFGSGEIALRVDKNDLTTTEYPTFPTTLPADTVYSGLPAGYTFAPGETSKTFRVTVELPISVSFGAYGFGVTAARGGRTEKAPIGIAYTGGSTFSVSGFTTLTGLNMKVDYTLTPKSATYVGAVTIDRGPDGTLTDIETGGILTALPSGATVTGLPTTLTFDGTGTAKTASFNIKLPDGTSTLFPFGIRAISKFPNGMTASESVLKLDYFSR